MPRVAWRRVSTADTREATLSLRQYRPSARAASSGVVQAKVFFTATLSRENGVAASRAGAGCARSTPALREKKAKVGRSRASNPARLQSAGTECAGGRRGAFRGGGSWSVHFDIHDSSPYTQWGADYTHVGSLYTAVNQSWNGNIPSTQAINFGLCANKTGGNWRPQLVSSSINQAQVEKSLGRLPEARVLLEGSLELRDHPASTRLARYDADRRRGALVHAFRFPETRSWRRPTHPACPTESLEHRLRPSHRHLNRFRRVRLPLSLSRRRPLPAVPSPSPPSNS